MCIRSPAPHDCRYLFRARKRQRLQPNGTQSSLDNILFNDNVIVNRSQLSSYTLFSYATYSPGSLGSSSCFSSVSIFGNASALLLSWLLLNFVPLGLFRSVNPRWSFAKRSSYLNTISGSMGTSSVLLAPISSTGSFQYVICLPFHHWSYIYYQFRSLRRGRRIGLQMKDLSYFSLFFNVLFWMIICNVWGLRSPQLRVLRLYLVFVKCVWLDKASLSLL